MTVRCECCSNPTHTRDGQPVICVTCVMDLERCGPIRPLPFVSEPVGTLEGFRAYMLQQHGLTANDEALEFALTRARSYSGSEAGVYTVAARWIVQAAEAQDDP